MGVYGYRLFERKHIPVRPSRLKINTKNQSQQLVQAVEVLTGYLARKSRTFAYSVQLPITVQETRKLQLMSIRLLKKRNHSNVGLYNTRRQTTQDFRQDIHRCSFALWCRYLHLWRHAPDTGWTWILVWLILLPLLTSHELLPTCNRRPRSERQCF